MRLMSLEQVAKTLDVPPSLICQWIKEGNFPDPVYVGSLKRWPSAIIEYWALKRPSRGDEERYAPKEKPVKLVYFIQCGSFMKIGVADEVLSRLATLQTANPEPLSLVHSMPGGYELESLLHLRFAEHRVRPGGEWFRDCEAIRTFIAENGGGE